MNNKFNIIRKKGAMPEAHLDSDVECDFCSLHGTTYLKIIFIPVIYGARGGVVVKALRYKPAGRGFDSRWCHWNFSVI